MKYLFSLFVAFVVLSCNPTKDKAVTTYFGGEIINPKTNFVLFLKDNMVIDTLTLDENNRFLTSFKNFNEGLYTFKHGNEFQYIYMEPSDSLLMRLNYWDFDESLVFSGKGSSKNEFLINLFLQNEKEEKELFKYFKLPENEFQAKLNELLKERELNYAHFKLNAPLLSDGLKNLISAAIHYPLYRLKEIYPFYHKKYNKHLKSPILSEHFYDYRKQIDLNNTNLISFYPYQNYLTNYLYNLSYQLKEKDSTKSNITVNVMNALVENIDSEEIKNILLKRIVVNDFLKNGSTCSINDEILTIFLKNCTNKEFKLQVKNLVSDSEFIKNNKPLTNFNIVSYTNKQTNILDVIENKQAVIYFWTTEYMSPDYIVTRIKYLEKKHPTILFIGINMLPNFEHITTEPSLKKLSIEKQYKLTENSKAHKFLESNYPRAIIVNESGIVVNGFTYLDSEKFSSELYKLQIK